MLTNDEALVIINRYPNYRGGYTTKEQQQVIEQAYDRLDAEAKRLMQREIEHNRIVNASSGNGAPT